MQYKLWQSFFQNKWVLNNMSAFIRLFGSTTQTWLINPSLPDQSAPDNKADRRLIYSAPPWFGFRVCWLWDTCVCMYMSSVCMCLPCDLEVRLKSMLKIKSSVEEEGQSFTRKSPVDALAEKKTLLLHLQQKPNTNKLQWTCMRLKITMYKWLAWVTSDHVYRRGKLFKLNSWRLWIVPVFMRVRNNTGSRMVCLLLHTVNYD